MLIDTHSHLSFASYDTDREQVHARMAEFGIKTITVGTAITTSRDAVAYAEKHDDTWASVGYHPDHVTSDHIEEDEAGALDEPFDVKELERLAVSSARVIAIGETGLDYHYFTQDGNIKQGLTIEQAKIEQQKVFLEHADLSAKLDKTLIVHARDSFDDMQEALRTIKTQHPELRIVMHGFSSAWHQAEAYLDLGCYLGIGGIVTFKPRKDTPVQDTLASIASRIPLDRLLLETDAPWLAPIPVRGTRNEPAHVRHIAQHIANLRGLEFSEICATTTENAEQAFDCEFS